MAKFKIPFNVRIKVRSSYEVVFVDDFKDGQTLGECRPGTKQIVIKANEPKSQQLSTFIHELLHAASAEDDIGLTEKQVLALEKLSGHIQSR